MAVGCHLLAERRDLGVLRVGEVERVAGRPHLVAARRRVLVVAADRLLPALRRQHLRGELQPVVVERLAQPRVALPVDRVVDVPHAFVLEVDGHRVIVGQREVHDFLVDGVPLVLQAGGDAVTETLRRALVVFNDAGSQWHLRELRLEGAVDLGAAVELSLEADLLAVARVLLSVDVPQVRILVVRRVDRLAADVGDAFAVDVAGAAVGQDGVADEREDVVGVDELVHAADVRVTTALVVTRLQHQLPAVHTAVRVGPADERLDAVERTDEGTWVEGVGLARDRADGDRRRCDACVGRNVAETAAGATAWTTTGSTTASRTCRRARARNAAAATDDRPAWAGAHAGEGLTRRPDRLRTGRLLLRLHESG